MPRLTHCILAVLALSFNPMTPAYPQQGVTMTGSDGAAVVAAFGDSGAVVSDDPIPAVSYPSNVSEDAVYLKALAASVIAANAVPWTFGTLEGSGYAPGGYAAIYPDDMASQVRCGANIATHADIEATVAVFLSVQSSGDIPEALYADGSSTLNYNYAAPCWNLIDIVYSDFKATGNANIWVANRAGLIAALEFPAVSNHLACSVPPNRSWGFEAATTGYSLMGSLLRFRAYRQAAEMDALSEASRSGEFYGEASAIKSALQTHLWDAESGFFLRCSGESIRHAAGTAYAIVLGACSGTVATAARAALVANWSNIVLYGHVRQYPFPDAIPAGDYGSVGGAWWGCFAGWIAIALGEPYASLILGDYADYYRANPSGAPNEYINDAGVASGAAGYGASAANAAQIYYGVTTR
jgi:hypothetical protein